ncbi:filamentous hemagglutinin, partial [[Haemophilus] felis]|nr:filamentous hemagglutinin [[Haemophilus] felis]
KVEFGFGSSWEFSGNASAEGGKSNSKQVNEQAGLFAEEGGYHISADNVHLKGGVIASTNAKNSELTTNKLTFENINNSANYGATSGAISGGYSQSGTSVNPSLPMHEQGEDSTTTKATLTEGKITLNKDSQPTETTAAALGINTDLSQANKQVEQPKDVNRLLKEQKEISANVGHIATAASNFSNQQAKEAEAEKRKAGEELAKAKASGDVAKIDEKQSAYNEASIKAEAWGEGGSNRRKVDATVAVVGAILAGKTTAQVAVAAVSPELNAQIHEITKDSKTANLFAHAALSAAEFYVAGLDPASGALVGVMGEGSAMLLAEKVFNKQPSELTAEEKGLLKAASQLAGAIAGGVASNSTATAVEGMATAKRAVENNFLSQKEWEELERLSKKKVLTYNEALRVVYLTKKDVNSDKLLSQYQAQFNGGKALSDIETATLLKWVAEYGSRADQTVLLHTPVNAPQIRPDYSDLITKSKKIVSYGNTFESRQAESLKVGLETVAGLGVNNAIINTTGKLGTAILNSDKVAKITHSALVVNSGLNNAGKALVNVAQRYPLTTELSVTGIVNTGYQLSQDRPYNPYDLLQAGFSTALTRNKSLDKQLSINVMLSTLNTENSSDYG